MSGANVNVSDFRPHQRPCVRLCLCVYMCARARVRAQRLAQRSQPEVTALLFITTTWWLCCCCCCYQSCCRHRVRLHSGAVTCNQQLILEWTWWITVVWIICKFVFQPSEASFLAIESPPFFFGTSCIKSRCLFPSCVYICECKCASPQTGTAVLLCCGAK